MANSYWATRVANQTLWNLQKNQTATDAELARLYRKSANRVIIDIKDLWDTLTIELKGDAIRPNDLYKYNRYWAVLSDLNKNLSSLGEKEIKVLDPALIDMYDKVQDILSKNAMYKPIVYSSVGAEAARRAVDTIWCSDGKHWSARVWENISNMEEKVMSGLFDCIARGVSKDQLTDELMKTFSSGYSRTSTLVRTELSHIRNQSTIDRYKAAGITEYEIISDNNPNRCEICEELNHKRVKIEDMAVGDNIPPFHPNAHAL